MTSTISAAPVVGGVAGYCRISLDGDGRGLGVERQSEDVLTLANVWRLPLDAADVIVENDPPSKPGRASKASASSYSTKPRTKYLRLIERVKSGEVTHVLAYSTSRLTRDMVEREELLALRHLGATIITAMGQRIYPGMSSTEVDMIRMIGVTETGYSDKISEATKRTFDQNAEKGTPHGPVAYGWDRGRTDGGTPVDTINEAQANVLRDIAQRMIGGEATGAIMRDLNERQVPAPNGGTWSVKGINNLMLRERNAARRVHRGVVVGPATWEALYDDDTHEAVLAHLRDPSRASARGELKYLLSGLMICGVCASTHVYSAAPGGRLKSGAVRGAAYGCRDCYGVRRLHEPIDEYVADAVCERLTRSEALDWLTVDRARLKAARQRLVTLKGKLADRVDMLDNEEMTREEFARSSARIRGDIAAAEAERDAARPIPGAVRLLAGLGTFEATREAWDELGLDAKRDIVRTLVDVTLLPTGGGRRKVTLDDVLRLDWKTAL